MQNGLIIGAHIAWAHVQTGSGWRAVESDAWR